MFSSKHRGSPQLAGIKPFSVGSSHWFIEYLNTARRIVLEQFVYVCKRCITSLILFSQVLLESVPGKQVRKLAEGQVNKPWKKLPQTFPEKRPIPDQPPRHWTLNRLLLVPRIHKPDSYVELMAPPLLKTYFSRKRCRRRVPFSCLGGVEVGVAGGLA